MGSEDAGLTPADDRPLFVEHDAVAVEVLGALLDDLSQTGVKGVREADMADDTALKEGERPDTLGAIDDLVGNDKVHGLDLLAKGADGGEGDDAADADVSQGGDAGAVGHLVGRELVVQAVAGEEGDVGAVVGEDADGRGRRAPGGDGVEHGDGLVALQLAQAGAADYGDVDGLYGAVTRSELTVHSAEGHGGRCWWVSEYDGGRTVKGGGEVAHFGSGARRGRVVQGGFGCRGDCIGR